MTAQKCSGLKCHAQLVVCDPEDHVEWPLAVTDL